MSLPVATEVYLELRRAMLCADSDCDTIFSAQPQCPRCASTVFYPLASWLDRDMGGQ